MSSWVLTKKEADKLLIQKEGKISISLDLGISSTEVLIKDGFVYIKNIELPLEYFKKIKEKTCYAIEDNILKPIALFSEETNIYYKLLPTNDWPTITLSSTPMHRYSSISPKKDTEMKIKEISPITGIILDTCCGLGYTSILSSKKAQRVITFERDPNVLQIAKYNPYSQELFSSKNIEIIQKDIFKEMYKFKYFFFDRIIHDPPTFKYSPELYSKDFHKELHRVLKKGGILYHYCSCPQKTKGKTLYPRMIKQLKEIGFSNVIYHEYSSGIRAIKQ